MRIRIIKRFSESFFQVFLKLNKRDAAQTMNAMYN